MAFGSAGNIYYDGKELDDSDTSEGLKMPTGSEILCKGGFSFKEPLIWKRFKHVENNSYCYQEGTQWDAVAFKAKRNVMYSGFLWNREYNDKPFTLKHKFRIDSGDWIECEFPEQSKSDIIEDEPLKLHKFNI